jgi:3-methyladenine DNA glycosylase/8-oxoguanine DNA glycosylase
MRRIAPYTGVEPSVKRWSHFHYLARAITYQQLAGKAAATIFGRVQDLTPGPGFPRPEQLLEMEEDKLRAAGLSRAKTAAIKDLSTKVLDGTVQLRSLGRLPDEEVIHRLVQVRGVGEWTAQMFLMFKLGRLDVMPAGDLGVQEGMRRLDGLETRPSAKELLARSEPWRPLRTVASWMLWRLCDS